MNVSLWVLLSAALALPACDDGGQGGYEDMTSVEGMELSEERPMPRGERRERGDRAERGVPAFPGLMKMFAEADGDGDGRLTEAEVRAAALLRFKDLDKNGDGYLDEEERKAMFGAGRGSRGPGAGPGAPGERFMRADKDGDGRISREEAPPRMAIFFDKLDADGDGYVTLEEARAKFGQVARFGPLARMDADGDGKISSEEFVNGHVVLFKRVDEKGTGSIGLEDIVAAGRKAMGPGGPGPRQGPAGGRGLNIENRFAELDGNKDGKVTKAEAEAGHRQRFAEIDKNKDGVLDASEVAAYYEAKREDRRGRRAPGVLRMDKDGDGKVTLAEFLQHHEMWFDRADANKDGVVTVEELRAARPGKRGPGARR